MSIFSTRVFKTGGVVLGKIGREILTPYPLGVTPASPLRDGGLVPVALGRVAVCAKALQISLVEEVAADRVRDDMIYHLRRLYAAVPGAFGA